MEFADPTKATLRPRVAGEALKVRETVLKRRDRNLKANAARSDAIRAERRKKKNAKRIDKLVTPARLIKDALVRKRDAKRLLRVNKGKQVRVPTGADATRVLVAVRNHRKKPTPAVKDVLRKMGLLEIATLVFLPHTEDTLKSLKIAAPFLYWGTPTFKLVNDLLHKKAHFRLTEEMDSSVAQEVGVGENNDPPESKGAAVSDRKAKRELLSSNALIEEHLGSLGVLCVEDLVSVIFNREDKFAEVCARLWPIELGAYTTEKAEGFKIEGKKHIFGDQKRNITKIVTAVL